MSCKLPFTINTSLECSNAGNSKINLVVGKGSSIKLAPRTIKPLVATDRGKRIFTYRTTILGYLHFIIPAGGRRAKIYVNGSENVFIM